MAEPIWAGKYLWIWMVSAQDQGDIAAIVQQAQELGLRGILVKAADGPNIWSQFNQPLVDACHAAGLTIGAWVFVYGDNVPGEAAAATHALAFGPDWLVIDAESAYAGKPQQALQYGAALQQAYPHIPLAYAPYAIPSYHQTFPYQQFSHFCQVVLPQQYWADIGWTVDYTFTRSAQELAAFGRPIAPIGQAYPQATPVEIDQFGALVSAAGMAGMSFWDWQSATPALLNAVAYTGTVQSGSTGMAVRVVQTLLNITVTGTFDTTTLAAVRAFQQAQGIVQDGVVGPVTWQKLWHMADSQGIKVTPQTVSSVVPVPDQQIAQTMAQIQTLKQEATGLATTVGKTASALAEDEKALADLTPQIAALEEQLRVASSPALYQETGHHGIYVALNGTLHHIPNMTTFTKLGFVGSDIQHVATLPLPLGAPMASL